MTDFSREDGFPRRSAAAVELEVPVAEHLDHFRTQRFRRTGQGDIASGICRAGYRTELAPFVVDDAFSANDDDVLLKVIEIPDPFDNAFDIDRMLGNQNDVRLPVSRAEGDIPGLAAHHFDNRDAPMTLSRGANALDALCGNHDGGRIARRGVVDDLVEIEDC